MSVEKQRQDIKKKSAYVSPEIVAMGDVSQLTGGPSEKDSDFPNTGWKNPYPDAIPPDPLSNLDQHLS